MIAAILGTLALFCVALVVALAWADAIEAGVKRGAWDAHDDAVWRSNMDKVYDAEAEAEAMRGGNG